MNNNNKILLSDFIKKFNVNNLLDLDGSKLFKLFSLSQVHKDRNLTYEDIQNSIIDSHNNGGIDSLMVLINDEIIIGIEDIDDFPFSSKTQSRFIFTQCKKQESFDDFSIDELISSIQLLLDLNKDEEALLNIFNPYLVTQRMLLTEVWKKTAIEGGKLIVDFDFINFAVDNSHNEVFQEKLNQLKDVTQKNLSATATIETRLFSSEELFLLYQKRKSNRVVIEFDRSPLSIKFNQNGQGYIGTVKLSEYKKFLTSEGDIIRDDFFESNIRHFQGPVDVNNKIKKTIQDQGDEDFWWLNNGITIIAENPDGFGNSLAIENVQIVNGLQTSYSIFHNVDLDKEDDRSVLVKIIINKDKDTIDHIIASTNSQNQISSILLRATEPIQRKLELYFSNKGYFYDRRKNYYKNQNRPSEKIFSIQYTAQSIQSIIFDEPHSARAKPTSLLNRDTTYNKIFDPNKSFQGYLNCCIINRKVHNFWLKFHDQDLKSKTSNFKFHLSSLIVKSYYRSAEVSFEEIVDIDLNKINIDLFKSSIYKLGRMIDLYLKENKKSNLVNIAKSRAFTSFLFRKSFKSKKPLNFIEQIIEKDIDSDNEKEIITRFPPEPNGFLHIGHVKAICINFETAKKYGGRTNLRFDDTNPLTEKTFYVNNIKNDIKWLGYDWEDRVYYASDYFQQLYDYAVDLIKKGLAYIDESTPEEIAEMKGTPTSPGVDSPFRNRSVEENLRLFEEMKDGVHPDGSMVLRAKVDMKHPNMLMRDPNIYRIKKAHHHRTGDDWCIYPLYDFAHGQSDSIENITYSLCSLEFRHHRDLYNWLIEKLEIFPSRQIEFARMNVEYMITSKRRLLKLVNDNLVTGWDDPRMPTISGMRRKGYPPAALRTFVDKVGVAKRDNLIEIGLLESCVRDELNKTTARVMGVLDPLKLIITNYPEGQVEQMEAVNNPEDESMGTRTIPFSRELYIEQGDFMEDAPKKFFRLGPGKTVRLKNGYIITCEDFKKDENGKVIEVHCKYYPDSRSGSDTSGIKAKGVLHWVSIEHAVKVTINNYHRLFTVEQPLADPDKDFMEFFNEDSLEVLDNVYVEPSLLTAKAGERFQFMRKGYYCLDTTSTEDNLVFNSTVGLKDSWAKKNKKK